MNNLPGFEAWNEGAVSTLGEYPAFQPGSDGLYVLQLNADGLEEQSDIISAATDVIDTDTTISF
jgi:hypothetical protein